MKLEDLTARAAEQRREGHLRVPDRLLGLARRVETHLLPANHGKALNADGKEFLANRATRRAMRQAATRETRHNRRAVRREANEAARLA